MNQTQKGNKQGISLGDILQSAPGKLSMDHAVALAQQVERYESALKMMKDHLKAFVTLHGPVSANGKVFDFMESTPKWSFEPVNTKSLATAISIEGGDPWKYLTIDVNTLKKAGYSEDLLSLYGKKKPGNKSFRSVQEKNYKGH